MKNDTIAAIATAVSNAGISMIRLSGADSLLIVDKIYQSKKKKKLSQQKSHTIHYGFIYDGDEIIDEVMVALMKGPNSYTKEDIVEIDCHGGIVVTRKILDLVIKKGARPAEPGEFTKRAFLNGRIDLTEAEAVMDLIQAKNELSAKNSMNQLRGSIRDKIAELRKEMIRDIAFIEAALDDPEHIEIDGFADELSNHIYLYTKEISSLLEKSLDGKILKEGIHTVILGKPNAGKSSLLNLLVGQDRAIVTEVAGTTRDTLEESISLGNVMLNLIDTAGIRDTEDLVEKLGVEKAKNAAKEADLILYVMDASKPIDTNDEIVLSLIENKNVIILLNKMDLKQVLSKDMIYFHNGHPIIEVSAKNEEGLEVIKEQIETMFFHGQININDEIYITNARHKSALENCKNSLIQVKNSIEIGMSEDFYTIDLMNACEELGTIIGESVSEELIQTIFSEFCMGK